MKRLMAKVDSKFKGTYIRKLIITMSVILTLVMVSFYFWLSLYGQIFSNLNYYYRTKINLGQMFNGITILHSTFSDIIYLK